MEKFFFDSKKGRIALEVPESVYFPEEDSLLMAEVIESMEASLEDSRMLEIGCGSGFLSILAAKMGAVVTAVDINPHAVGAACKNAEANSVHLTAIQSDLFSNVAGVFDLIVFNAPYLPDKDNEIPGREQWSLHSGRGNIIERFIGECGKHMHENSRMLLLFSSLSGDAEAMLKESRFNCKIIARKKLDFEEIFVAQAEISK